jgi:hypothetical protein
MAQNTFHVAISVKDLPTAIEQYTKMLGIEPEGGKQVIVVQHQIPQAVELVEVIGLCRTRMRGRVDPVVRRQIIEKAVPFLAKRTVQEYYR